MQKYNVSLLITTLSLMFGSVYGVNSLKGNQSCTLPINGESLTSCDFIIEFKSNAQSLNDLTLKDKKLKKVKNLKGGKVAVVEVNNQQQLDQLKSDGNVKRIIPDRKVDALGKPSGKGKDRQASDSVQVIPTGVQRIGATPSMMVYKGNGVGIAVLDTGIDLDNPDLNVSSVCWVNQGYGSCNDFNGHGTHVAGIIAAKDNNIGVVGVAPMSTVYAVKVLDDNGSGSDSTIMSGLQWVLDNAEQVYPNIKVINMSLGRQGNIDDNPLLRNLIQQLESRNISIVVAAGNDPAMEVKNMVPATYPEVISVASTTAQDGSSKCSSYRAFIAQDTASYFTTDGKLDTNSGIGVTISAPGSAREDISRRCNISALGILSLGLDGSNVRMNGTSMAAPHVAGVASLLQEYYGGSLSGSQLKYLLRNNVIGVGVTPNHSPTSSYSFDGEKEGIVSACQLFSAC